MPAFVEQYNFGMCYNLEFIVHILCHYHKIIAILLQAMKSQSIWRQLEELQVTDEGSTSLYTQIYSIGFLCRQLIHISALSPHAL